MHKPVGKIVAANVFVMFVLRLAATLLPGFGDCILLPRYVTNKKCKILLVINIKNFALRWRCALAVRAGFEPAVQFNPYGSLANY